jgi:anti-sigma B factor antagonist
MPELNCRLQAVKNCPDVAVVTITGSIDPRNLSTLEAVLEAASGRGFRTVILDVGEVRYINSAGLGYLVNLSDGLAVRGGGLVLANAQPKVKVVFDLMGVSQFFKLHKSVQSAVAALAATRAARRRPSSTGTFGRRHP